MAARGRAARALEDELPAHELAVIFAHRALCRLEARIGQIGAAGELPAIAEQSGRADRMDRACSVELVAFARLVRELALDVVDPPEPSRIPKLVGSVSRN